MVHVQLFPVDRLFRFDHKSRLDGLKLP